MADVIERRIIEIAIDNSQVLQQLEQTQNLLNQSVVSFERMGQAGSAALTAIESRLAPSITGFEKLTLQVNAYVSALTLAEQRARGFVAPSFLTQAPAAAPVALGGLELASGQGGSSARLGELYQTAEYMAAQQAAEARRVLDAMQTTAGRNAMRRIGDAVDSPLRGFDPYTQSSSSSFRQQYNEGAFVPQDYQPVLGGPLAPIYPTRFPNRGLGNPLMRDSDYPDWRDPLGVYGTSQLSRTPYEFMPPSGQSAMRGFEFEPPAVNERELWAPIIEQQQKKVADAVRKSFSTPGMSEFGTRMEAANLQQDFFSRPIGERVLQTQIGSEQIERLKNEMPQLYQAMERNAGQVRSANDVYRLWEQGLIKSSEAVELLGNKTGGTNRLLGALEYSMLRSLAVMGVMWGAISLVSQATEQWVANTVEADYTMNMMGFTTEKTRGEMASLTREIMNVSAQYGLGPQQSLPAGLLASRSTQNPQDILELARGGAQLSVITGKDQEAATRDLIEIQKKWNLEAGETGRIVDIMASAYKNTIAPLDQFSEALVRMSAFGRENNLTLEQTAGLIAGFMTATGVSQPSRAETFFEMIGGLQTRPESMETLRQQGFGTYDQNGELLSTMELVNNIAARWGEMSEQEQKTTVLALVGRQRLNEGMDYFNNYMSQAITTSDKFNDTLGKGNAMLENRGQSIKGAWTNFWAGVDAQLSDPDIGRRMRSQDFGLGEDIVRGFGWRPASERTQPVSQPGDAEFVGPVRPRGATAPGVTPTISAQAQQVIAEYGSMEKLSMTGAQFDTAAAEATKQAYANIEQAARSNATTEQERAAIVTRINERMNETIVLYQLQGGEVRSVRADVAALLEEQNKAARLPGLQTTNLSGGELDSAINRARGLAAQYKATIEQAGFSTQGLDDEWNKTAIAIRTSDGAIRVLNGSAAVFLQQALQIGRAVQTWQAPQFQVTDLTPDQWQRQQAVANQLAQQYIQQIRASNIPLAEQNRIIQQTQDEWATQVQFIRLANGQIVQATGATVAFAAAAGQVTAGWERAALAIAKAAQARPNIQTMPELNDAYAAQLQQYLIQYENLLRSMNVPQTPQQYMIFGQNGSMYQFVTSSDAMQLAMALLMEQIQFNSAALEDSTDATNDFNKKTDQLRGSYNLPTEWGYRPPTPWEYYDDAKKTGRKVDMGPINYPWLFPDDDGAGGSGSSKLSSFLKQPHLGLVPGGAGTLLPSTFGKTIGTELDPAALMQLESSKLFDASVGKFDVAVSRLAGEENPFSGMKNPRQGYQEPLSEKIGGVGWLGTNALTMPLMAQMLTWQQRFSQMLPQAQEAQEAWADPLRGKGRFTQGFGEHPENYKRFGLAGHDGLDYAAAEGTPIYPVAPGTITRVGYGKDYGYQVWERLANGIEVLYAHMAQAPNVQVGQTVDTQTQLGLVGSTGNSTGPHLHLGVKDPNQPGAPGMGGFVDPKQFFEKTTMSVQGMMQVQASVGMMAQNTQTLQTQIPNTLTGINTNTSALVQRVPLGLAAISTGITGSNLQMAQMINYLSRIATTVGRPPIVNISVGDETLVIEKPAPPINRFGTSGGIGIAGGAVS